MKKNECCMMVLLVVLMVTGFLFHPLAAYYHILSCIHSLAAVALVICVVIHVKKYKMNH
ncbi:MAG: hypothetical protein K6G05_04155 [Lachnospiraceae bacterium]|nr:hypothetical protein [Lachnospiraceae bacterium]